MGGPAYDFDAQNRSVFRWPSYYNGVPLFYEWTRDYVKEFRLNRPTAGSSTRSGTFRSRDGRQPDGHGVRP